MLESMKRLFGHASDYKKKMIGSVVLAIGSVAAGVFPYFIVHRLIVELIRENPGRKILVVYSVLIGLLLILKSVLFSWSTSTSHQAAYRILRNIRLALADKITKLPLGYVLERDSGVLKKVIENDVEELERFLAHNIPETISSIVVPVMVVIYLFTLDGGMAVSFIIFIPLAVLCYYLMMRGSKAKMKHYYNAVDKMNGVVVEYVGGMKEIKAFNQSDSSFTRYRNAIENYRHYVLVWYQSSWPLMSAYYVLLGATAAAVLPVGLIRSLNGTLEVTTLILFLLISLSFSAPLIKLSEFADGIILVIAAEQNIHGILSEPDMEIREHIEQPKDHNIEFHEVNFSYGEKPVLKEVSFIAKANESLAIVGSSGGGKSTIAKLMCRFWDVDSGKITLGGVDIRDLPVTVLMNQISFVFQDTFLFNVSLEDNIRVGKPEATTQEVIEAAKRAKCHEFIMKTEFGYQTLAGSAGGRLSGGERQRICIARAILKNAPILLLDEATASIDPDSEEEIQDALGELARGKTLIVIAHRIRTIMSFDKIIVVNEGHIEAGGTHLELLAISETYQRLYQAYATTESWKITRAEAELCGIQ